MAVTSIPAPRFMEALLEEGIDLDTQDVKVLLTTDSYTFDPATHVFRSAVSNEVTGTGYTAGGETAGTVTVGTAAGVVKLDVADVIWSDSSITARRAVFYVDKGSAATDPIIGVWDFGENKSSSGGEFKLTINANGLVTFQA
ncbi:MAG: hypothetical protein ACRDXB_08215 [Actinomycetes bacterium]